ncbi:hypothetical protein Tco_1327688 [Tanacetum coccineum]
MESQSETTQTVSALKLPILKTGDYDLWSMRMEQYLTHTDYALWEVIMNGDASAIASASTEGLIPPKTAEQKLVRNKELKAKSIMLLAILDEHLLKFHGIKDAKTLWEATKTRFGGTDIAKISRKRSKPDKHRHGKGKSVQELGECYQSTRGSNHELPHWQSVCSLNDPRAKIREPMIKKNEEEGFMGASNKIQDLEASLKAI